MGEIQGTLVLHHQVQVVLGQSWGRARGIWEYLEGAEGVQQGCGRGYRGRYGWNMKGYRKGPELGHRWRNAGDMAGTGSWRCSGGEIWGDMMSTGN